MRSSLVLGRKESIAISSTHVVESFQCTRAPETNEMLFVLQELKSLQDI